MSFLNDLLGRKDPNHVMQPLYNAVIAQGRRVDWYEQGSVPDTLDGRFDMIAAMLCLVLIRLEQDDAARQEIAWLTELFVKDMDGQLRQIGIGDMIVGKRVGEMMSALGGRLGAYRNALSGNGDIEEAMTRNLYRGNVPDAAALKHSVKNFTDLHHHLSEMTTKDVLAGNIAKVES